MEPRARDHDRGVAPEESAAEPAPESAATTTGTSLSAHRRPRSPRSSKVTIIRPSATDSDPAGDADSHDETVSPLAWATTPASGELVARLAALNAEIEELQRQALEAKRAEAAEAVRWIKRAIADYDLTAADLGF